MRLLFTCRPVPGHYDPLLPLARAAREAGHAVRFATGEPAAGRARQAGFEAFEAGLAADALAGEFPREGRPTGDAGRLIAFTRLFADRELEPRARDLERIVADWRPDVIVHEAAELAAPPVAICAGIPYATLSFGSLLPSWLAAAAGEAAAPHWRAHGLEPDPLAGLYRHLYLDRWPPSLQVPEIAALARVQHLSPADPPTPVAAAAPDWLDELGRPTVYITLGTLWNGPAVFRALLEPLRGEPVDVVVTVGRDNDPAALGSQRPGIRIERFVPQALLLPRCDAVVAHGGSGSVIGALAHGLPLVVVPQGADQFTNAERIVAAGAGIALEGELSPAAVRDAVRAVLDEPRYRAAAQAIAAEIRAMPGPEAALAALEALVASGR